MKRIIPNFKDFLNEKKERKWDDKELGFSIHKSLLPLVDKNIKGTTELEFTISFGVSNLSYFKNLLWDAKSSGFIKDYEILNVEQVNRRIHKFKIKVDIVNWYDFLHRMDDGHVDDLKII